ncbi:anthranilate synthase component II [Prevotella falsenii]|uniref:anthranilate synthase component II n=1 Tax=Prevotella falsenii TaxID=515414 RepID=UPI00046B0063|nr:aminodeoxychorismate/anthranilate synthase component II [Prevotella falsenii]
MKKVKCVIIDNYDSFTYNLVHLLRELGAEVAVKQNDKFALEDLKEYDKIVLSPGPGVPSEAGLLLDVIRRYAATKPMLGVCLGHQAIAEAFGGSIEKLSNVFHGVETIINVNTHTRLFNGLPAQISVGRYHSWVVSKDSFPAELEVIAETADGLIMALQHKEYDLYGIQFHPESVLTPMGKAIVGNWLAI